MSATIFTIEDATKSNIVVISNGKGTQAVHDVVVAMRANRRSGSANTKTKAEVDLSGAKPWKQKGTGRARAGYKSSPVWVGGGVVFGPKPRDYSKNVPKAVKKLAFRKALSARIIAGDVLLVESFLVSEPKTKVFTALVKSLVQEARKTLIVGSAFDENTFKAARNVPNSQLVNANDVNTEQLLGYDKIVVTKEAMQQISKRVNS